MQALGIFLKGLDNIEDVKQIRCDAIASGNMGVVSKWTSNNKSVEKVHDWPTQQIILECNQFLRIWCPQVRQDNPIVTGVRVDFR